MATTGHESEAINVQGLKASLQKLKTNHIDGKAGKSTTLAGYGITDAYTKSETYTKTEVNGLVDTPHQEYVTVDAYANLPETGSKDTIYRVSNYNGSTNQVDASVYSEYAWNGTQYIFLCVKSQIGEVFDISVYNNNAKYADLAAALGTDGEHVPQSLRKGGMSVKFVRSSDNKYVQYRLMKNVWSTTVSDWQGVDDSPTYNSNNLVKSSGIDKSLKKVSDTVLEFVGEGSTQVNIFNISLYKGHKYSLSGLDYNYTASTNSKVMIYGHKEGESDVVIASAAYNRTQQLIFEVIADYDTFYARCRANVGDKVYLLLNDVTDVYPQMAYAVPISGAFNLTLNYTTSPKTHKLTIPSSFDLVSDTYSKRYSYSGDDVIFQNNGDREQLLVFNLKSLTFRSENGNRPAFSLDENDSILGTIDVSTGNCYFNFQYTENNLPVVRNGYDSVPTTDSPKLLTSGAVKAALDGIGSPSHNLLPDGNYNKGLSLFPFVLDYLEEKYWNDEMSTFNSLVSAVNSRQGMYKIAFVTDTHEGGFYALNGTSSLRCVALFNKLANFVDIFAHGGDISCDYGTSVDRYFAYMLEAINFFNIPAAKNFLITKGNHDARDVEYDEVSPLDVDWSNGTYFENPSHGDESKFTEVTQQTYRGGGLYVADAGRLSDSKFRFVQAKNAPIDAVWGSGAYYYYDIASTKIRFVVANSYSYKDDGTSGSTDESKWLMQTALDLHDKATPSDWLVVIIRHKEGTTSNDLKNILQAFQSGSSVTIAGVTVNYGTLNGGGCNLIYLHGHEHGSAGYSNMNGYLDLGFKNACVSISDLGDAEKYNIYVLSVDTANKKLISDCINGNSYTYDYVNSIVELSIGDSILMARSGLSSQSGATWVSSDDSVAIVGEHTGIVTGVSAGTATITGTKESFVRTYTVKVVS